MGKAEGLGGSSQTNWRPGVTWGEQGRGLTGAGQAMGLPAWGQQGICEGRRQDRRSRRPWEARQMGVGI